MRTEIGGGDQILAPVTRAHVGIVGSRQEFGEGRIDRRRREMADEKRVPDRVRSSGIDADGVLEGCREYCQSADGVGVVEECGIVNRQHLSGPKATGVRQGDEGGSGEQAVLFDRVEGCAVSRSLRMVEQSYEVRDTTLRERSMGGDDLGDHLSFVLIVVAVVVLF
ncbi:MAG: hypothetical protein IPH81_02450 [Candidatus Microthrix sp.]|nr:hypothetical protein [Candidatus Microthrix sp.]